MAAKKYLVEFRVRGNGSFPGDMLRYDQCFPRSGGDVVSIFATHRDFGSSFLKEREIELVTYSDTNRVNVNTARWNSFGWEVMSTRISKL